MGDQSNQPPPVLVAQPVLVPVRASPVLYAPSSAADLFFYDGRYYTSATTSGSTRRSAARWLAISIGRVSQQVAATAIPAHDSRRRPSV